METQLLMKLPTQLHVWKPCTMLYCTSLMQTRATMGHRSTLQPEKSTFWKTSFLMQLQIIRLLLLLFFFADLKMPTLASLVILITSLHHFVWNGTEVGSFDSRRSFVSGRAVNDWTQNHLKHVGKWKISCLIQSSSRNFVLRIRKPTTCTCCTSEGENQDYLETD